MSYDNFEAKKDRIYFTLENQKYDAGIFTLGSTPGPLGPAVQKEIPGIANARMDKQGMPQCFLPMGALCIFCDYKTDETKIKKRNRI